MKMRLVDIRHRHSARLILTIYRENSTNQSSTAFFLSFLLRFYLIINLENSYVCVIQVNIEKRNVREICSLLNIRREETTDDRIVFAAK